jgi:glycine/D-amino acid oxidase-like deaminating enzyme
MSELRTQWGSAPWSRPAFSGSTQALPNRPDVAIIGGGLTGLSTDYHLARAGTRPVLLEAGLIADGASGRSGGLVLEGTAAGILDQVDRCVPGLKAIVEESIAILRFPDVGKWRIEWAWSERSRGPMTANR